MTAVPNDFGPQAGGVPNDFEAKPTAGAPQVPNDFGPEPQAKPPVTPPPVLRHDIANEVSLASQKYGVPQWALSAMAGIESGGMKDPIHAVNHSSGAMGVLQLIPSTFTATAPPGANPFSLKDNVEAGARYYASLLKKYNDPVKAAGAYNVGPGAFDEYLAGKRSLPQETVAYMARVAAAQTPHDVMPTPPHDTSRPNLIARRQAPVPKDRKHNQDPTKARHDPLQELAGHQDLPFILRNAMAMDSMLGTKSQHHDEALKMWLADPAAASDKYGVNSKAVLQAYAAHGKPWQQAEAKYLLAHPWAAAGETFLEEFLNPMSILEGGMIGKGLGWGAQLAAKTEMGRRLLHAASPYREIVAKFGTNARNLIAQMGANIARRDSDAMKVAQEIFGGHTLDEQHEIVHRSQNLGRTDQHGLFVKDKPELTRKAALLRQVIKKATAEQLGAQVLDKKNVYDSDIFFPMKGAYDSPIYNDQTMSFLDQLRPNVRKASATPFANPTKQHKTFARLSDSLASPAFDRMKLVPSENLYRFLKARGGNVELDNGLRKLAAAHPDLIREDGWQNYTLSAKPWQQTAYETEREALDRTLAENRAKYPQGHPNRIETRTPTDRYGRQMVRAEDALGEVASPFLKNAWIAPELKAFLSRDGASTMSGKADFSDDRFMGAWSKFWERYNGTMRAMIMQNPLYHPFWNIASNTAAAAREHIGEWMGNYARAMIGTAASMPEFFDAVGLKGVSNVMGKGRDALEHTFWKGAQQYANDVAEAAHAGAQAEFGAGKTALGGDPAKIRTLAYESLGLGEKLDKFLTGLADWNKSATFGQHGEEQFATSLYKKFTDPNGKWRMAPEDAAWAVREALGNYQNVNPNAWQSKLLFFYPWLKTNVPFWLKTFLTAPRYATAPTQALRRESQLAGDPRAEDPNYPRAGTQAYLGKDHDGENVTYSAPLPLKDAERVSGIVDPRLPQMGGPGLTERLQDAQQIVESRLRPGAGFIADAAQTIAGKAAPAGTYQGFDTLYNKDAPGGEQAKEFAGSAARRLIPQPFPFLAQDVEKQGFKEDRLGDYAIELASLGYISRTDADSLKHQSARAMMKFETQKKRLDKRMHSSHPLPFAEYQKRLRKFYDEYQKRNEVIRKNLASRVKETPQVPNDFGAAQIPDDFGPLPNDFGK